MVWILWLPNKNTFYLSRFSSICSVLKQQQYSNFAVLRKKNDTRFSSSYQDYTLNNCNARDYGQFELKYRPLIGDHLHIGYILSLDGERIILHDRNITEPIPYEHKPHSCQGNISYTKVFLHSGIHTHCDEIIHIHPWSAYTPLEGRDVTLAEWFKSVKIEDYNHHDKGYKIRDKFYHLKMAYYENVRQEKPSLVSTDHQEISGLWLKDHHGMIVLFTGNQPEVTEEDIERVIKMNKYPKDYP
jgi:hypothetical protein